MVGPPEPEPEPEPEPSPLNRSRGPHNGFLDDFPGYDIIMQPMMQTTMQTTENLRICD
jgi:hypothetical protein